MTQVTYRWLVHREDKDTAELFIRDSGVRASTIWHDRYVENREPEQIADDRDLNLEAILEALDYCQRHWSVILTERQRERAELEAAGYFNRSVG